MPPSTSRAQKTHSIQSNVSDTKNQKSELYERPESPTLPPELNHNGLNSNTNSVYSTNDMNYLKLNLNNNNSSRSSGIIPMSPNSILGQTERQKPEVYEASYRSSKTKSTLIKQKSNHLPQQKISDHLAAAIELSTTNTISSPAPAAGMYWSRCLTYGRGPSRPLRAHTSNLIGEKLYVFGGCDTSSCFNTLYILDMDTLTWSKPRVYSQDSPPPCRAHSCTVVERELGTGRKSYQLYIFGGGNGPEYFNDVYIFDIDTLTWSKPNIDPSTKPPKRRAHTSCLWNNKLVIIGGGDGARALDDVYTLDISNPYSDQMKWEKLKTEGIAPPARGYHTSNLIKDKIILYGGSDGHDCFDDIYVLDLESNKWSQIEIDRKIPRLAHTSTQVGSYVFVVGGHDGRRYSQDIILFNLVTMSWEARKIHGTPPSPRGYHTAVLYDSRLYIIGGYDGKNVFDDAYMLELSACAYLPQITNFEIDI